MSDAYPFWRGLWHAGLGPATYAGGLTGALLQLSGRWDTTPAPELAITLIGTLIGALGMVLLDRVKWRDSLLDPADMAADPLRTRFLGPHTGRWRVVAVLCALVGSGLAWVHGGVIGSAVVLIGFGAMGLYAGKPAGGRASLWRLKDIPVVKNSFTSAGLVCLSLGVALGREAADVLSGEILELLGYLLLVVMIDAMLCDIPDTESDGAHGVRTVPVLIGVRRSWVIAIVGVTLAGGAWALLAEPRVRGVSIAWGVTLSVSSVLVARLPSSRIKTLIDMRPACITLAWALGSAL